MDSASLSALYALCGSVVGALASIGSTWLTQYHQGRVQQRIQECSRRERLYGEFIKQASTLYAEAVTRDQPDSDKPGSLYAVKAKLASLYAVKAQLGLFASQPTLDRAEEVLLLIIETCYKPAPDLSDRETLISGKGDFLRAFAEASRKDLAV